MGEDSTDETVSLLELGTDSAKSIDKSDEDIQDPDQFKEKYDKTIILDQIRGIVRQYGEDGIAASVVADMADVTTDTARRHLNKLCSLREVYKQKKNKQVWLYYPNGKPLHGIGTRRIESPKDDIVFELQLAQGKHDDLYFHMKEKRFSLLEGERTEGAVMFPMDRLDDFISEMNELASEVEEE